METLTNRLDRAANESPEYAERVFMDCLATFGADDFRTSRAFRALTIAEARSLRTRRESAERAEATLGALAWERVRADQKISA